MQPELIYKCPAYHSNHTTVTTLNTLPECSFLQVLHYTTRWVLSLTFRRMLGFGEKISRPRSEQRSRRDLIFTAGKKSSTHANVITSGPGSWSWLSVTCTPGCTTTSCSFSHAFNVHALSASTASARTFPVARHLLHWSPQMATRFISGQHPSGRGRTAWSERPPAWSGNFQQKKGVFSTVSSC